MKFNERYPKEQVKLLETDSSQVVTKIIDHMVDVGFTGTVLEKNTVNIFRFIRMNCDSDHSEYGEISGVTSEY